MWLPSPENAGVECKGDNGGDVGGVDCALCGMSLVVTPNVGVVTGVACGLGVDGDGVGGLLVVPFLNEGMGGINQTVLGDGGGGKSWCDGGELL